MVRHTRSFYLTKYKTAGAQPRSRHEVLAERKIQVVRHREGLGLVALKKKKFKIKKKIEPNNQTTKHENENENESG